MGMVEKAPEVARAAEEFQQAIADLHSVGVRGFAGAIGHYGEGAILTMRSTGPVATWYPSGFARMSARGSVM